MTDGIRIKTNNFEYAAWPKRLVALAIDMALVNIIMLIIFPGSIRLFYLLAAQNWSLLPQHFTTFDGIIFWVLPMIYMILMQGFFSRTVGMMLMKTKVADGNGKNITWLNAVFRTFAYMLSGLILFLGFLPILFTPKRQGLHDRLTKTFVILKR